MIVSHLTVTTTTTGHNKSDQDQNELKEKEPIMYDFQDELTRHSLLCQMLNDQGARLIDDGDYLEAIDVLIKALKLYEQDNEKEGTAEQAISNSSGSHSSKRINKPSDNTPRKRRRKSNNDGKDDDDTRVCNCHHCRLETCFSRSIVISKSSSTGTVTSTSNIDSGNFIFCHPVYCAPTFSHENHHRPGEKLCAIIVFNLALSYHLMCLMWMSTLTMSSPLPQPPQPTTTSTTCDPTILRLSKKALQFYELFYQLQKERNIFSTQAMLAVANNVSEIYRVIGDYSKHKICLQHLTSCLVLASEDIRAQQQQQQQEQQPTESSSESISLVTESSFETTEPDIMVRNDHPQQYQRVQLTIDSNEMKGYWKNASKMILHDNCAGTA